MQRGRPRKNPIVPTETPVIIPSVPSEEPTAFTAPEPLQTVATQASKDLCAALDATTIPKRPRGRPRKNPIDVTAPIVIPKIESIEPTIAPVIAPVQTSVIPVVAINATTETPTTPITDSPKKRGRPKKSKEPEDKSSRIAPTSPYLKKEDDYEAIKTQEDRTPEDMVDELLKKGVSWHGILAVARQVRKGSWREKVQQILQDRQLMPVNPEEIVKRREEVLKKYKDAQAEALKPKPKKGKDLDSIGEKL